MRTRRLTLCLLALLTGALAAAAPVQINVTASPSLPAQNRLPNADFAGHEGDRPAGWQFMSARPDNFAVGWTQVGHSAPGSLWIKTFTGAMSGYWYQAVPVTAGEKVMVWSWVRTAGGQTLLYLTGDVQPPAGQRYTFDERALLASQKSFALAPVWIKREYLRGPDPESWLLLRKVLDIPAGMTNLTVHLGSYFMPGEFWADDLYVGPALLDLAVQVQGERLARVKVLAGRDVIADSGDLGGVNEWSKTLPQLDAARGYVVEATTVAGIVTHSEPCPQDYPAN